MPVDDHHCLRVPEPPLVPSARESQRVRERVEGEADFTFPQGVNFGYVVNRSRYGLLCELAQLNVCCKWHAENCQSAREPLTRE